ncbi:hypothetical protein CCU22_02145 [Candidatus Legionella polyplacis]|uniref:benzoate/H(+) symporter BenE family transporter n=1 Tax=Candidatus Legionella polyplacis TaxID=2005262 RepID=UPI000C1E7EBE|nr:benzoate/H(+) symporter BenE family transporter [Candidatus Legionella polyplacis]ATW01986.1 hypothetical protein CCU22_02145 [Candidatus Legionella polyplacis]
MRKYISFSNLNAGFTAVMIGFFSSSAIVFQLPLAFGLSFKEASSWIFVLSVGIFLTCVGFSTYYKMPILTAWSTPGAAFLITNLYYGVSLNEFIGIFMFCGFLTVLFGITGWFKNIIMRIPKFIVYSMLSGVLLHFGINFFKAMQSQFLLVLSMYFVYLIGKKILSEYTIFLVLFIGILISFLKKLLIFHPLYFNLIKLTYIKPKFSFYSLINIGLPLFFIMMMTQNLPAITIINSFKYNPPISSLIIWIGIITIFLAPFGCYSINLSTFTAPICMGSDAHKDPSKRYKSVIFAGFFFLFIGLIGGSLMFSVLSIFPKELITAITGLSLLSIISKSLYMSFNIVDQYAREASLVTFIIIFSGISFLGISSIFCGLILGLFVYFFKKKDFFL